MANPHILTIFGVSSRRFANLFVDSKELVPSPFSCGCGDPKTLWHGHDIVIVEAPRGACLVASPSIKTSTEVAFSGADDNEFQPKVRPCRRPIFVFVYVLHDTLENGSPCYCIDRMTMTLSLSKVNLYASTPSTSPPPAGSANVRSPTPGSKLPAAKAVLSRRHRAEKRLFCCASYKKWTLLLVLKATTQSAHFKTMTVLNRYRQSVSHKLKFSSDAPLPTG